MLVLGSVLLSPNKTLQQCRNYFLATIPQLDLKQQFSQTMFPGANSFVWGGGAGGALQPWIENLNHRGKDVFSINPGDGTIRTVQLCPHERVASAAWDHSIPTRYHPLQWNLTWLKKRVNILRFVNTHICIYTCRCIFQWKNQNISSQPMLDCQSLQRVHPWNLMSG